MRGTRIVAFSHLEVVHAATVIMATAGHEQPTAGNWQNQHTAGQAHTQEQKASYQ